MYLLKCDQTCLGRKAMFNEVYYSPSIERWAWFSQVSYIRRTKPHLFCWDSGKEKTGCRKKTPQKKRDILDCSNWWVRNANKNSGKRAKEHLSFQSLRYLCLIHDTCNKLTSSKRAYCMCTWLDYMTMEDHIWWYCLKSHRPPIRLVCWRTLAS